MQSHTLTYRPALPRPDTAAVRRAAVFFVRSGVAWWQALVARGAYTRTLKRLSAFDDHLLRDIGAPPGMLQDIQVMRDMERNRRMRWLRP
jgi:uncharacterized protein YjiS (DUF1127 family)